MPYSQLPAGKFHLITTVSNTPSGFMYVYTNTTEEARRLLGEGRSELCIVVHNVRGLLAVNPVSALLFQ